MLDAFLMGLVGGQRAMTPLAMVAVAASRGGLARGNGAPRVLSHPVVAMGCVALAVAEMAGDKMPSAPDRIVPIGLTARFITSAIAGAALSPRRDRPMAAMVGGVTAVLASYPGWRARCAAMEHESQAVTGFVEDAAVLAAATAIVRATT